MIGSAVYSSDDGGPADESAAMEELVTELRQEITVKNKSADRLLLSYMISRFILLLHIQLVRSTCITPC